MINVYAKFEVLTFTRYSNMFKIGWFGWLGFT